MKTYELACVISSQMTSEEAQAKAQEIESLLQHHQGVIMKSEKVAVRSLAYPIASRSSGYFDMLEFQAPEPAIKEIRDGLDRDAAVLRYLITIKKPFKEMKERRTRKPLMAARATEGMPAAGEGKAEKVDAADLDKKLDEILGE